MVNATHGQRSFGILALGIALVACSGAQSSATEDPGAAMESTDPDGEMSSDGGQQADPSPDTTPDGSSVQGTSAGNALFVEENTPRTDQPIPANVSGAWVTLIGRGGNGTKGTRVGNKSQNAAGGDGGSGGARVGRVFIPVSAMGPTYTTSLGTVGDANVRFRSGKIDLAAGWGHDGSMVGGKASASGIDDVPLGNGGGGGTGGLGTNGGRPGESVTNGAGGGGGGGGGGRSQNVSQGGGGAGGTSTGGDPVGLGAGGAKGTGGTHINTNSASGGSGGGGGGATAPKGSTGGEGLLRIEWQ